MKIATVFLLTLSTCLVGFAQGSKAPAEPLIFRIIPEDSTIPSGSKFLTLRVELENTSRRTLRLSPAGIGAYVGFSSKGCSLEDGFRNQSTSSDPWPSFKGKLISIAPGRTYQHVIKLTLNPEFFTPGMYSVSLTFSGGYGGSGVKGAYMGSVSSNAVFFQIAESDDHSAAATPPATGPSH